MEENTEKQDEGQDVEPQSDSDIKNNQDNIKTDEPSAQENSELTNQDNSEPSGETNLKEDKSSEQTSDNPEPTEAPKENVQEKKDEPSVVPKSKEGKEGSWTPMIVVMGLSLVIAFAWDKVSWISGSVHSVLDPSAGALLNWNLVGGMILIVLAINIITTLIQKYATDQDALRELKKEQKILQAEMKKYKDHPEKIAELSKKQMQFIPKTFKLTSRAIMFTGVPFILFFRWFNDVFTAIEIAAGEPVKFFGILSWFWFYLIFTMVLSSIFRKVFKVV